MEPNQKLQRNEVQLKTIMSNQRKARKKTFKVKQEVN